MVRLFHFSDTHLGYQAYTRLGSDGLNQREVDFQEAFRRAIDHALETRPDVVVHAGDLFDVVRPSNRAIAFALHQVRRLSQAGVPFVVASGNHEAPRLRETGSIFRIFEGLPHVHPVYQGEYEAIPLDTPGGRVTIHAVPQALQQASFAKELARAEPQGGGQHVLVVHGTVAGVDGLFTNEWNELAVPQSALRPEYDYVALGHFHNHRRILENGAYSGSTERTSFAEAGEEKVYLDVDLGGGRPKISASSSGARPMRDAGALDAHGWSPKDIHSEATQRLAAVATPGAIVRLIVRGLEPAVVRSLDVDAIRRAAGDVVHVDLRLETRSDDAHQQALPQLGSLEDEFDGFFANHPLPGVDRTPVRERAVSYLRTSGGAADAA